jgi:hypothetical protein
VNRARGRSRRGVGVVNRLCVLCCCNRSGCVRNKMDGWLTVSSLAGLDVCLSVSVVIVYCLPSFKVRALSAVSDCFVLPR